MCCTGKQSWGHAFSYLSCDVSKPQSDVLKTNSPKVTALYFPIMQIKDHLSLLLFDLNPSIFYFTYYANGKLAWCEREVKYLD